MFLQPVSKKLDILCFRVVSMRRPSVKCVIKYLKGAVTKLTGSISQTAVLPFTSLNKVERSGRPDIRTYTHI